MRLWDKFEELRKSFDPGIEEVLDEAFSKRGSRFSKEDQGHLDKAHDCVAKLCDGAHCSNAQPGEHPGEEEAGMLGPNIKVLKRGSRHSGADMMAMKSAHDALVSLGAKCP
jgi:hypothetical protein